MIKARGIIRYGKTNVVGDVDPQISRYYFSLLPKSLKLSSQRYKSHITITRPQYKEEPDMSAWGLYQGELFIYYYEPIVISGGSYFWINCYSKKLEEVRRSLGLYTLDRFAPAQEPFEKTFHITIGNNK